MGLVVVEIAELDCEVTDLRRCKNDGDNVEGADQENPIFLLHHKKLICIKEGEQQYEGIPGYVANS